MIIVANKRTYKHRDGDVVIPVHRGFPLGNPWTHIQTFKTKALYVCKTREQSIEKYKDWLQEEMQKNREIMEQLNRICDAHKAGKQVVLLCYCDPLPCHAEFVKELVERMAKNENP